MINRLKNNFKVDFIGIGTPKSGTSWTAECLKEHPQICFSQEKEINFFNKKYVFYRKNEDWKYSYGLDWYKKHFNHCEQGQIKGEFSVQYLSDTDSAKLIHENFPETKIIIILRNPTDRLYSHYLYAKAQFNLPSSLSFEKVIQKEKKFVGQGFYYQHIKRYLNYFARKNVLIMIYEDMQKNPRNFIQQIYKFLEVDNKFIPPSLYQKVNPTPLNLSLWKLSGRIKKNAWGRKFIKLLKILKLDKVIKKIILSGKSRKTYKKMSFSTRKKLNEIYHSDIKKLEELLNRDLSFWK